VQLPEALNRLLKHFSTLRKHPSHEMAAGALVVVESRTRNRDNTAPLGKL
jgi:hypothetical protein